MTRQDRLDYYDIPENRRRVAPYVDRLLKSDALVFSFPVWNMGFPAILKGFVDKVFLPGVRFQFEGRRRVRALPAQRQAARRGLHLWRSALDDLFVMGDPPRRFLKRSMRSELRARRELRLPREYDMDHTTPAQRRARFLKSVERKFATW